MSKNMDNDGMKVLILFANIFSREYLSFAKGSILLMMGEIMEWTLLL